LGGGVATAHKEAPELRGLIALGSKSCVFRGREVGLGLLHAFELNDRYTFRRLTYSSDRCLPARDDLGPVGVADRADRLSPFLKRGSVNHLKFSDEVGGSRDTRRGGQQQKPNAAVVICRT
jgi:hypothetical protein